ncbi:MAG: hypothetical protein M1815_001591 [Lichina confinis]|nr:MAG: hypothetical protein M1815_001591 [Lichina confinis]
MSTPVKEYPPTLPTTQDGSLRSSDDDKTFQGEESVKSSAAKPNLKPVDTAHEGQQPLRSPSMNREQASRLDDDLEVARIEQAVSEANEDEQALAKTTTRRRERRVEVADEFDIATNPVHEKNKKYAPPENPSTKVARIFKRVHRSTFLVRYFFYITPVVALILVPLLLGLLVFPRATVGGVRLFWFSIWLEIVWLTLWAGRIVSKCLPYPIGLVSSLFTNNSKKWRDLGEQLEVPATIFLWWLAIQVSFLPTMRNHHLDGNKETKNWQRTMNKVITAVFVGTTLNFVEKLIIQLIAMDFHLRTYSHRIDTVKFQIGVLRKLYQYSKAQIAMDDSDFEEHDVDGGPGSGTQTPMRYLARAKENARGAFSKVGDVAGKVAQDFTGRRVSQSTDPHQVVLALLRTTSGCQVMARRLYRTFAREDCDLVYRDDLSPAFDPANDDETEAAFQMFDKDLNGDVSMEELEAVCVEIGREKKSITNALKDLDSVVTKLDHVLVFIIGVVTLLVFLTLVSSSAATVLASAGTTMLGLAWCFAATAQEFLQSIIFVFVKHPFDVGDRVSIYGNTGAQGKGDDYFVKNISLLYTEFKKMEGHVVQAPNSYLNTLFILNMRRSGGLAEGVPIIVKFGTTLEQIDALRQRLLEFVIGEKREYQGKILTELREVDEAHAIKLNVVFFYKSNWQNELLRLQRRNKFICALMVSMLELNIEGPRMRYPGQKEESPFYLGGHLPSSLHRAPHLHHRRHPDGGGSSAGGMFGGGGVGGDQHRSAAEDVAPAAGPEDGSAFPAPSVSVRPPKESATAMSKRVDFSLGMSSIVSGDLMSDLYDDPDRSRKMAGSSSLPGHRRPSADGGHSARATSRDHSEPGRGSVDGLVRDSSRSRHDTRHRLFGRGRRDTGRQDGDEEDLEMGPMPNIPEMHSTAEGPRRHGAAGGRAPPRSMTMQNPRRSETTIFGKR